MKVLKAESGFTLIEMMLVVIIIGILASMVVPSFVGRAREARVKAAQGDIATQTGMFMSLDMWRQFLKPRLKETIDAVKAIRPDIKVFYHSCGKVEPFIPELIEAGVDILHPVQPDCLDPADIKQKFGKDLIFFGTISVQKTMPFGTPDDVRAEVKSRIEKVGYDGGLILCPSHVLAPEVPWENIVAFFEAVDD